MATEKKNPNKIKNGGEGTGIGKWLRSIDREDILNATSVVANFATGNVAGGLGAIKTMIDGDKAMSAEQRAQANKLIELEYADLADARSMQVQVATSEHSTEYAKNFIYYLATGTFLFSACIVLMLFFVTIPEGNKDVINFILGIIVGTGLVGIFQFFFGSSKGSKDSGAELRRLLNKKK